jgi:hypothetical protein
MLRLPLLLSVEKIAWSQSLLDDENYAYIFWVYIIYSIEQKGIFAADRKRSQGGGVSIELFR